MNSLLWSIARAVIIWVLSFVAAMALLELVDRAIDPRPCPCVCEGSRNE